MLTAYLHGHRAGWFRQEGPKVVFEYDRQWLGLSGTQVLSLSLPKSRVLHEGTSPAAYLQGLLPDNREVLTRWGRRFQVSATNPLALLEHVGLDTAGAVQLGTDDTTLLESEGGLEMLDDTEIGAHIRHLRADPAAWDLPGEHEGNFSLAGAQAKFGLQRTSTGWARPWGSEPSTHIVKPGITGLRDQDLDEHLSQAAAGRLGLAVASSRVREFDGERAIVIERYDRRLAGGHWERIHQEDFCQALGVDPALKYQSDGGPSIASSTALLRSVVRRRSADREVESFLLASAYNWIISGTDAHAKNYSLLHGERNTTLAPLYDIASTLPYDDLHERKVKMAMSVGGRYRLHEIDVAHWRREAEGLDVDPDSLVEQISDLAERTPDAFRAVIDESAFSGSERAFAVLLLDKVSARVQRLRGDLGRSSSSAT